MTEHGKFLSDDGELGMIGFQRLIVSQMRAYTNRKITEALVKSQDETASESLFALRMMMVNIDKINDRLEQLDPQTSLAKDQSKKDILMRLMKGPMVRA